MHQLGFKTLNCLLFQNTELLHRSGLLACVFSIYCLCCFSSTGTDSSIARIWVHALIIHTYRMNWSAILCCSKLYFLFLLTCCHFQDSSALYQEIEKGTTGCSTLTKLSFGGHSWNRLPSQLSSASMQAAITMQSSLTEVKWSFCSFSGKSNIGVTACAYIWMYVCDW